MKARGWLEVVPDEDGRSQPFRLTPQGRKLLEKAVPAWSEAQQQQQQQQQVKKVLGVGFVEQLNQAEVSESSQPINYNPCLECKLCVAACPVGAISAEGDFNFSACYTHNYREFMGGFTDWVEQVADSSSARNYRGRVSDAESASMWQSLSYGANYLFVETDPAF